MKKTYVLSLLLVLTVTSFSQSKVSVNLGQTFSKFRFRDSQGNEDPNMTFVVKNSYGLAYENLLYKGWFIRPEIGYKNLGAQSYSNNTNLLWDLHYIDLSAGGGYMFLTKSIRPYVGASMYVSYLLKANETIGSDSYNLIANNALKKFDFGVNVFTGVKYRIENNIDIFVECRWSNGLLQLDNNLNGGSKELYNNATSFHVGVVFDLFQNNIKETK